MDASNALLQTASEPAAASASRRWLYPVLILTALYTINAVDRLIFNVLAEPLRTDLQLRDWHIGVITGFAFSVVYSLAALPIARLAERTNRVRLISIALVVWSSFTIASSFARSFLGLAATRLGVGLGESGFSPAAYSLIADTVPQSRRTFAFGIFYSAMPIGTLVAMGLGGIIADQWGWRWALLIAGGPGLLLAPIVWLTVKDPRDCVPRPATGESSTIKSVAAVLSKKRSFVLMVIAQGLYSVTGYGMLAFLASFYFRNHGSELQALATSLNAALGTQLGEAGVLGPILGLITGVGGIVGALISGWLTDRLVARDRANFGWMGAIPHVVALPLFIAAIYWHGIIGSFVLIALYLIVQAMPGPSFWSCVQSLVSSNMRATATALALLTIVLIGNGLGPLLIGVTSDLFALSGHDAGSALRLALLAGQIPATVALVLFILARKPIRSDVVD